MADGNGFAGPDTYANEGAPAPDIVIDIEEDAPSEPKLSPNGTLETELPDGSLLIDFSGGRSKKRAGAAAHDANLAEYVDEIELGRISNDLLDGINNDLQTRQDWLDRRAAGMK